MATNFCFANEKLHHTCRICSYWFYEGLTIFTI